MLDLRPSCENCSRPLPPASRDARICPVDRAAHAVFAAQLAAIPPHER